MNGARWILAIAVAIVCALPGVSATAQSGNGTIFLQVRDWNTGGPITGACFVLENASLEGCDENGDGYIRFADVAPGRYQVIETVTAPGHLPVGQFPIEVAAGVDDQVFLIETTEDDSSTATVDVAVHPIVAGSGEELTGGCFLFYGGSNEGCDENRDGFVEFDDVPVGSYLLTQTEEIDGYAPMANTWYALDISGIVRPGLEPLDDDGGSETSNIALITRDPETTELVSGTCYVLVDFSNEGCDENGDGRVTFDDVPAGVYEVEQTATPTSAETPAVFSIEVDANFPVQQFLVKQAEAQNESGTRNLSVGFYDTDTGEMVAGSEICVTVEGDIEATYDRNPREFVSNEGCDDNDDGFIDFFDVPIGDHRIAISGEELPDHTFVNDLGYGIEDNEFANEVWIVNVTAE